MAVRIALGAEKLNDKYLDEIMTQFILDHSPGRLLGAIRLYITAQFHDD